MNNEKFVTFRKMSHPQNADMAQGWEETDVNDTLNVFDTGESRTPTIVLENQKFEVYENHSQDSRCRLMGDICETVSAKYGTGGNNMPLVIGGGTALHDDETPKCVGNGQIHMLHEQDEAGALNCMHEQQIVMKKEESEVVDIVRRLTPLECERLQGFPDFWSDIGEWIDSKGKKHKPSDTPRYKALGNSLCLPFWEWLAARMTKQLKEDGVENPTMGSLFSGIGGFELVFKRSGCEPKWASEIEEFAVAVTKKHFGDEETGEQGDLDKYMKGGENNDYLH